jgi:uncharacterized protein YbjQ (UPF0145 family)
MGTIMADDIIVTSTLENIPGMDIEQHLGFISGNYIVGHGFVSKLTNNLKNFFGGHVETSAKEFEEARTKALENMLSQAKTLGANAVLNIRFSNAVTEDGTYEVFVYGTAVRAVKY